MRWMAVACSVADASAGGEVRGEVSFCCDAVGSLAVCKWRKSGSASEQLSEIRFGGVSAHVGYCRCLVVAI